MLISLIFVLFFSFTMLIAAEDKVKITFWGTPFFQKEGEEFGFYENSVAREFEEMYPNVEVEVQINPWAKGKEKVEIAIASGTAPDIFHGADNGLFDKISRGLVLSFDEIYTEWEKRRFNDFIQDTCFVDGKMMALAYSSGALPGLMINTDLAKKAGAYDLIPLDDPLRRWSHEECLEFFRKCKSLTEEGIYAYAIPAINSIGDLSTRQLMVQFGMEIFNEDGTKLIMNSPEGVESLEWIVALNDEGLIYPNPETLSGLDILNLFFDWKLVSWYGARTTYTMVDKWTKLVPNHVFVQFPTVGGANPKASSGVGGFVVFDNRDPVKARYAKLFCKYFASKDFSEHLVTFSPFTDGENPDYGNENLAFMGRCTPFGGKYFGETNPYYANLREVFYPELQAAFLKIKTPQEALDDLCDTMNALMKE